MNIEQARFNMIEQQIRPWDVLDADVLELLLVVKREHYVPAAHKGLAFVDAEIPLGHGAAMLTPKLEARLLQDVNLKKHESVLEIGTGSGYMAALLAHKGRHVTSVEIDAELKQQAERNLAANAVGNVTVELGNGAQGWGTEQFDVIVVSGALPVLPEAFLKQLKVGGRLAAIIGQAPAMKATLVTRTGEAGYDTRTLFETDAAYLQHATTPSSFTF